MASLMHVFALACVAQATTSGYANLPEQASISLLQVHAERHDASPTSQQKQKQQVPATAHFSAADDLARGIKMLRESLTAQHKEVERSTQQTKAGFEARLLEQAKQGKEAARVNANLTNELNTLTQNNEKLVAKADSLRVECADLQANIKSLQENLSIAQDFVSETFKRLDNATSDPALAVLDELDQEDKVTASSTSHKNKLHAIERLSMLDIGSAPAANDSQASVLIKAMNFSLDEASDAQNATIEHMEASFQTRFEANAAKLEKLEEQRLSLVQDIAAKRERRNKLIAAVQALSTERDNLMKRRAQAAKFWHLLSGRPGHA